MTRHRLIFPLLIALPAAAAAQQPAPKPACESADYKHFDYWVGEWNVFNQQGAQIGSSRVTSISGGCAILEEWQAANNSGGKSLNFFDPADRKWHQIWVGGDGSVLRIAGGLQQDAMTLVGAERSTPQGTVRDRIVWTRQKDGAVEQRWELSSDGGATWKPSFVGIYRRK